VETETNKQVLVCYCEKSSRKLSNTEWIRKWGQKCHLGENV